MAKIAAPIELTSPDTLSSPVGDERTGCCPSGHGIMGRAQIPIGEGFYLERCSECWGVWFDQGEWSRLATHELLSDLPDFWNLSWQSAKRAERQEKEYLEWLEDRLGSSLFKAVDSLATQLRDHPAKSEAMAFLRTELNRSPNLPYRVAL